MEDDPVIAELKQIRTAIEWLLFAIVLLIAVVIAVAILTDGPL